MESTASLTVRITRLKSIAASIADGAIYTEILPQIDQILALPDEPTTATLSELEAIGRQVNEFEQSFDRLGYSLLLQLMPPSHDPPVFQIVRAADRFKAHLAQQHVSPAVSQVLTRYSLSIGTPPVTDAMRQLVAEITFGAAGRDLRRYAETISCPPAQFELLVKRIEQLLAGSMHYNTAAEEKQFLDEAADFVNFEGGRLFNRVVITGSPYYVNTLIAQHLFDKFGLLEDTQPFRLVDRVDGLDQELATQMQASPNRVFIVPITHLTHKQLRSLSADAAWQQMLGRLILVDHSRRAWLSNTTIVYTLFPHVATRLRTLQVNFAGRPANTQLVLRLLLEQFSVQSLQTIADGLNRRINALHAEGVTKLSLETFRVNDWQQEALWDYLTLSKLKRFVDFIIFVETATPEQMRAQQRGLSQKVAADWMRYFYSDLPHTTYPAAIVPGGGRGALTAVGEYHRQHVATLVGQFRKDILPRHHAALDTLKRELSIPQHSSEELHAAIRQSQQRATHASQWQIPQTPPGRTDHVARALLYRGAEAASRLTLRARDRVDHWAFANLSGGATAKIKKTMEQVGFGPLWDHFENRIKDPMQRADQRVRDTISPLQHAVRQLHHALQDWKGDIDPQSVGEIEGLLYNIAQDEFFPFVILPDMAWTYGDVLPEKDYPAANYLHIPLNEHHEIDPLVVLQRLETLRYRLRRFPELFQLICRSTLLIINSPHNPTSVTYRQETLLRLLHIASEYELTVIDDNAYHKLIAKTHRNREGDASVAQLYEQHRKQFTRAIRLVTVGATTKGLQGSGDRTGLVFSNHHEVINYISVRCPAQHALSLYLTQLKLEHGLTVKRYTKALEHTAGQLVDPNAAVLVQKQLRHCITELLDSAKTHADSTCSLLVLRCLADQHETLLRLRHRGASMRHVSQFFSRCLRQLKDLRIERQLRSDIEQRLNQATLAVMRSTQDAQLIPPTGAFYLCVKLCDGGQAQGIDEFLRCLAAHRKADFVYAGNGYVRLSLGGNLTGDAKSYHRLGAAIETYLRILHHYWAIYVAAQRNLNTLKSHFIKDGQLDLTTLYEDLSPLLQIHGVKPIPPLEKKNSSPIVTAQAFDILPSEIGQIYCIEPGSSVADKLFVSMQVCHSVEQMLQSRSFQVAYRRLLRKVYRQHERLGELTYAQVVAQYGPLSCLSAYRDRQLIDDDFRLLIKMLLDEWQSSRTMKVLVKAQQAGTYTDRIAALEGYNDLVSRLLNELVHAFELPTFPIAQSTTFDLGYEEATADSRAVAQIPDYLTPLIARIPFSGPMTSLNPMPNVVTGAAARVSDYRYGFLRRDHNADGHQDHHRPALDFFAQRLRQFGEDADALHYVAKTVQTGPFPLLLIIHRAYAHLLNDELRLFPQTAETLSGQTNWRGVLLFGVPAKMIGDCYKTGYILDRVDGKTWPVAWVAREEATDYVGFLKKSLLTLHNELVKSMGAMPVHGAMITLTFKNGLRKTLVFSADSGAGKSETITAMMEQMVEGKGVAASLRQVDILAGDMLSLWRGEDEQLYAFGSETGDFMRLTDITEQWKARYGDLLKRGSYSNLDHPKNPRVTIPGICQAENVLSPTRINGFFYINNYECPVNHSVEVSNDAGHVLKHVLVRGLRKNKGTSGDQPSLRSGLEAAGETALINRLQHRLDDLFDWQDRTIDGKKRVCLTFQDRGEDVFVAQDVAAQAFTGKTFSIEDKPNTVVSVELDIMENIFWLICRGRQRYVLDRFIYDQIYEPLVSTFCGNPFIEPIGMAPILATFSTAMQRAKVHTGIICTQLAVEGKEHSGPGQSAQDVIQFLLQDEEVSARFQRNKEKVLRAMQKWYGGIFSAGSQLPVLLEGYNLLLLEAHESTHVAFLDLSDQKFSVQTPYFKYDANKPADRRGEFRPTIALPEVIAAIDDVCGNRDYQLELDTLDLSISSYQAIWSWNNLAELAYQVLLINGVVQLGSNERDIERFPFETRKAYYIATLIAAANKQLMSS